MDTQAKRRSVKYCSLIDDRHDGGRTMTSLFAHARFDSLNGGMGVCRGWLQSLESPINLDALIIHLAAQEQWDLHQPMTARRDSTG